MSHKILNLVTLVLIALLQNYKYNSKIANIKLKMSGSV